VELLDLISEGNFALDTAMENFNRNAGIKFISYAVWQIRQAILDLIARQSRFVRITGTEAVQKANLDRASSKLAHKLNREPTILEKAENVGYTVEKVQHMELMLSNNTVASLDTDRSESSVNLQEIIPDTNAKSPDNIKDATEVVLKFLSDANLSEKEINVLTSFYGIKRHPRTLEDIRFDYDHSRERMRQIRDEALEKLRSFNKKAVMFNLPNLIEEVT
jgi:RNA polymerase primary sigma factor